MFRLPSKSRREAKGGKLVPMSQTLRAHSLSYLDAPSKNNSADESLTNKNTQSTVTCNYLTHIGGKWRNVTVCWCKNLMTHSLTISVDSLKGDYHHSCKIDLKSWHFWSKKGYKPFGIDGKQVDIYWDMRSVKYSGSPEPYSDYYVALVSEEEVVLLLGDYKKKAYKRTKSRPALMEPVLSNKIDHVYNKKYFSTRAKFDQRKREHDIVVESSTNGLRDPEMSITIDGIVVIHIRNLQWKFRGSQSILVHNIPVQVFWDVHAWLFSSPGSGHGWFVFKPGDLEFESDQEGGETDNKNCDNDNIGSFNSRYCSPLDQSKTWDFCHFLFAWKLE